MVFLTLDLDLIMDVEPGVAPREELLDLLPVDLFSLSSIFKTLWRKRLSSFIRSISGRT